MGTDEQICGGLVFPQSVSDAGQFGLSLVIGLLDFSIILRTRRSDGWVEEKKRTFIKNDVFSLYCVENYISMYF